MIANIRIGALLALAALPAYIAPRVVAQQGGDVSFPRKVNDASGSALSAANATIRALSGSYTTSVATRPEDRSFASGFARISHRVTVAHTRFEEQARMVTLQAGARENLSFRSAGTRPFLHRSDKRFSALMLLLPLSARHTREPAREIHS